MITLEYSIIMPVCIGVSVFLNHLRVLRRWRSLSVFSSFNGSSTMIKSALLPTILFPVPPHIMVGSFDLKQPLTVMSCAFQTFLPPDFGLS